MSPEKSKTEFAFLCFGVWYYSEHFQPLVPCSLFRHHVHPLRPFFTDVFFALYFMICVSSKFRNYIFFSALSESEINFIYEEVFCIAAFAIHLNAAADNAYGQQFMRVCQFVFINIYQSSKNLWRDVQTSTVGEERLYNVDVDVAMLVAACT